MSASNVNEEKIVKKYNDRLTAFAKYTQPNDPIPLNGKTVPASEASAKYTSGLDTRKVLDDKRTQEAIALQNRRQADAACRAIEKAVKRWVLSKWGEGSEQAIAFGVQPKTPAKPTTKVKAEAVDQAKATKKARGILGKKARRAIKATPAPSPSPAPSGNGASK
jgi:hypothetical protein